jgi:hypothetical protein
MDCFALRSSFSKNWSHAVYASINLAWEVVPNFFSNTVAEVFDGNSTIEVLQSFKFVVEGDLSGKVGWTSRVVGVLEAMITRVAVWEALSASHKTVVWQASLAGLVLRAGGGACTLNVVIVVFKFDTTFFLVTFSCALTVFHVTSVFKAADAVIPEVGAGDGDDLSNNSLVPVQRVVTAFHDVARAAVFWLGRFL